MRIVSKGGLRTADWGMRIGDLVMSELYLHRVVCYDWPKDAAGEVEAAFRADLPRHAARRMSRLGLLCTRVLREMPTGPDLAVVYATSVSEAQTLEAYLDSFPEASPMRFQGSIHPAGAQQALIALGRPTREFYPLAGGKDLFNQALETCLLAEAGEVVLVAGEERGGWLLEVELASEHSFALGLHISSRKEGAVAVLRRRADGGSGRAVSLREGFEQLAHQENWTLGAAPGYSWDWEWL